MTENNPRKRMETINEQLNRFGNRHISAEFLAEKCDCSVPTIKRLIARMREDYGAPIRYEAARNGYHYTEPFDFSAQIALSARDLNALEAAAATLRQFSHLEVFRDLRNAVDKIEKAVQFRFQNKGVLGAFLEFEQPVFFKGEEHIGFLLDAIRSNRTVEFEHQNYDTGASKMRRVKPYLVKEYRNRWYMIGWDEMRAHIRIFGLDRIIPTTLKVSEVRLLAPAFDAKTYFRHSIGIAAIQELEPEEVILSFSPVEGRYFKAQPFFPFNPEDVLADNAEEFRVKLNIVRNKELSYELARRGSAVQVISPHSLREEIINFYRDALSVYSI